MRTRAGIIDDDVSTASDKFGNAFLSDEDQHHLYNKATVWFALATAVLTESSIPRKIASCTLHCSSNGLAMVRIRMPQARSESAGCREWSFRALDAPQRCQDRFRAVREGGTTINDAIRTKAYRSHACGFGSEAGQDHLRFSHRPHQTANRGRGRYR